MNSFYLFIFFSLIAVARTSKTMLNSSGESWDPCVVPDFRRNVSIFCHEDNICCGFVIYGFYYIEVCFFYACFLERFFLFSFFPINGYLIFCRSFSAFIEIIVWILSFNLLIWCVILVDLQILKNFCTPGIKPT